MDLGNRDALLGELARQLNAPTKPHHPELDRTKLGNVKVTLFDDSGDELDDMGLAYAIEVLASGLWCTSRGIDISDAASLTVGTY